jgi:molybdopterin-guanine dinucleotide biosynthesis protein A
MISRFNCAGIILSGGLNARMGGRNKAFLELDGQSFLERLLSQLNACFQENLIVTREPLHYAGIRGSATVTRDILPVRSPLAGIHAGLTRMHSDFAFVTSCDTPLLSKNVIDIIIQETSADVDVVTPVQGTYFQPMCAVYAKRCTSAIEDMLEHGELKVDRLFDRVRLKTIPYEKFQAVDPELRSFFNVNTREDFEAICRIRARS